MINKHTNNELDTFNFSEDDYGPVWVWPDSADKALLVQIYSDVYPLTKTIPNQRDQDLVFRCYFTTA